MRDSGYRRWKKFRTADLKALHKLARSEIIKHIQIAKILYYARQFSNKSKWNLIRDIGTDFDIGVNKLNDQFVHSRVLASIGNTYDDRSCVSPHTPLVFVA